MEGKSLELFNLKKWALLKKIAISSIGSVSQVTKVALVHKCMLLNDIL